MAGFTVAAGVTTIREGAFIGCPKLASMGVIGGGVTVIDSRAFCHCSRITSLKGLAEGLRTIGICAFACTGLTSLDWLPSTVTSIGQLAFYSCAALTSIGPGLSPDCDVHSDAFYDCPALLAASEAKGFATIIEWGKHHWLVGSRRFDVLSSVRQVRRSLPPAPSSFLERIAFLCDDLVREVVEFVGACE